MHLAVLLLAAHLREAIQDTATVVQYGGNNGIGSNTGRSFRDERAHDLDLRLGT